MDICGCMMFMVLSRKREGAEGSSGVCIRGQCGVCVVRRCVAGSGKGNRGK